MHNYILLEVIQSLKKIQPIENEREIQSGQHMLKLEVNWSIVLCNLKCFDWLTNGIPLMITHKMDVISCQKIMITEQV